MNKSMKYNDTRTFAATLVAALTLAGAGTAWSAEAGTDYLSDASLMVKVTGGSETSEAGHGAVGYDYYIGTYEVTNAQWAKFLNTIGVTTSNNSLGLYNASQSSYGLTWNAGDSVFVGDNRPVNHVTFYDVARFVNWLTNGGSASSDTETGMYTLSLGTGIIRNTDAWAAGGFAIASEDEWYRAAYYNGAGGFYGFPWGDDAPSEVQTAANGANFNNNVGTTTEVGYYTNAVSYFGTYDQGGNVWEWTETGTGTGTPSRFIYGGWFINEWWFLSTMEESSRDSMTPASASNGGGFRIVSLTAVPEPAAWAALSGLALLAYAALRRRSGTRG
ncbi:MAG: SUMF1/EgtB/PvdO family nonheme iron enzyme [Opitutaceae bacterium]|jgi:hypothetical protein|nr:SUMF1/EgtB/PvdO family nonheme iron enzyme [Opitutaceae bacterium]